MNEIRKEPRILYDGEALLYIGELASVRAEICNISAGGMLIAIVEKRSRACKP